VKVQKPNEISNTSIPWCGKSQSSGDAVGINSVWRLCDDEDGTVAGTSKEGDSGDCEIVRRIFAANETPELSENVVR